MKYKIVDNEDKKLITGPGFNHMFCKSTGKALTWGDTYDEDPDFSPVGPLIADIEIVKGCRGIRDKEGNRSVCSFCYKSNTPNDINYMSLETFKTIVDKVPKSLGQIALGVDADATLNPDLFDIMKYCRSQHIIPNLTVADIGFETAQLISVYAGAVAVSYYPQIDKNRCYDSIDLLANKFKMKQVNIHCLVSDFMEDSIYELLEDIKTDPRLKNLNAVVFLSLKQKGRGVNFNRLSDEKYKKLVGVLNESGISYGFDSCSANRFLTAVSDHAQYGTFKQMSEPCESLCFSMYINENGKFTVCSFCENEKDIFEIDMLEVDDFLKDVWFNPKVVEIRKKIIDCRNCGKNCFYFNV